MCRYVSTLLLAYAIFLLPLCSQAADLIVCNPAGQTEDGTYVDTIIVSAQKREPDFPREDSERIAVREDDIEEFNALFLRRGWGDGLPMVPPTRARVDAMLSGYDLPGDLPIATLAPMDGVATVEKIAINAVMAGCEPRHMPLLVAAVEAVSQPEFDLRGMATTTNPDAVLMIVSGPIVEQMGLNASTGSFGRGNRANACISRALHLIIQNVGGSRQGSIDMSTLGQPGEFVMCLVENAAANPWPSFHTERGFAEGRNVVTVASAEGYSGVMGIGYSRTEYLDLIAGWMKGHDRPARTDIILLIAQDTAQMLAKEGWSRDKIKNYLKEQARVPYKDWIRQFPGDLGKKSGVPASVFAITDPETLVQRPYIERLSIIVAGGTGEKSMIIPCWAAGHMVSQEIRLPYGWK